MKVFLTSRFAAHLAQAFREPKLKYAELFPILFNAKNAK